MIVLGALVLIAQGAAADSHDAPTDWGTPLGAGIALGLAAVGLSLIHI